MNRAIRISLGLVLAVAITIVWALTRFHSAALEDAHASRPEIREPTPSLAAPEAQSLAHSPDDASQEDSNAPEDPARDASERAPAAAQAPGKPKISLSGTVYDSRGGPLRMDESSSELDSETSGRLEGFLELRKASSPKLWSRLDEGGHYFVTGLTAGEWEVHAGVRGYRPWHGSVALTDSDQNQTFDIHMNPVEILHVRVEVDLGNEHSEVQDRAPGSLGWLAEDGEAYQPVQVVLTREFQRGNLDDALRADIDSSLGSARDTHEGSSGPDRWLVQQSFAITADPPMYVSVVVGNRVLESRRVLSTQEEVSFFVSLSQIRSSFGGVRFRVVDDRGQPVNPSDLTVWLVRSRGGGEAFPRDWSGRTSDPSSGSHEVRIHALHPGPLGLEIHCASFATLQLETVVAPGVERDLGKFQLAHEREIRGSVVNPYGSPAQVQIECSTIRSVSQGPSPFQTQHCSTDSPGHFAFYHVGSGRYFIRASDGGREWSAATVVNTEDGSVDGLRLKLQESSLADFRLSKPGASSLRLTVQDEQGVVVEQLPMSVTDLSARAAAYLVPGRYTASAIGGGQIVASTTFVMGAKMLKIVLTRP